MIGFLILLLTPFISCHLQDLPPQTPIIGIFTQPYNNKTGTTYIAASYVKYLQMAGAQVVPIYSFSQTNDVLALLDHINGVIFPGGDVQFNMTNRYTQNANAILDYAIQQNENSNNFPIWGTCLGLQLLSYLTSSYNSSIITRVHGDNGTILPLNIISNGDMFQSLTTSQKDRVTKGTGLFYFNHNYAVTVDEFKSNSKLKNFWTLLATATTDHNENFVAAFESHRYPFYGVQFHPQKNPFEWRVLADRSYESVEIVHTLANKFIKQARQNKNRFSKIQEISSRNIHNFQTHIPATTSSFSQIYIFDQSPRNNLRNQ